MSEISFSKSLRSVIANCDELPSVDAMLASIKAKMPALNAATDAVNARIRRIESELSACGAGVDARWTLDGDVQVAGINGEYPFEDHETVDQKCAEMIAAEGPDSAWLAFFYKSVSVDYRRHAGQFRLVVVELAHWEEEDDDSVTSMKSEVIFEKPLADAPRQKKLYLSAFLPEIVYTIGESVEGMTAAAKAISESASPKAPSKADDVEYEIEFVDANGKPYKH